MDDLDSGERIIGCLPGEMPATFVLIAQARRYESELARLRARIAELELERDYWRTLANTLLVTATDESADAAIGAGIQGGIDAAMAAGRGGK